MQRLVRENFKLILALVTVLLVTILATLSHATQSEQEINSSPSLEQHFQKSKVLRELKQKFKKTTVTTLQEIKVRFSRSVDYVQKNGLGEDKRYIIEIYDNLTQLINFIHPENAPNALSLQSVLESIIASPANCTSINYIINLMKDCLEDIKKYEETYNFLGDPCQIPSEISLLIHNEELKEKTAFIQEKLGTSDLAVFNALQDIEHQYCQGHQFFYSTQTTAFALIYDLYSKMMNAIQLNNAQYVRRFNIEHPNIITKLQNVDQLLNYFKAEFWKIKFDRTDILRNMLLSVSYSLFNDPDWEGALFFYRQNTNASPWLTKSILYSFLDFFSLSEERKNEYYQLIQNTADSMIKTENKGAILQFIIKNDMVDKLTYLSKPYGLPLNMENIAGADIHTEKKGIFKNTKYSFNKFLNYYRAGQITPQDMEDIGAIKSGSLRQTEIENKLQARLLATALDFYNPENVRIIFHYSPKHQSILDDFYQKLNVMIETDIKNYLAKNKNKRSVDFPLLKVSSLVDLKLSQKQPGTSINGDKSQWTDAQPERALIESQIAKKFAEKEAQISKELAKQQALAEVSIAQKREEREAQAQEAFAQLAKREEEYAKAREEKEKQLAMERRQRETQEKETFAQLAKREEEYAKAREEKEKQLLKKMAEKREERERQIAQSQAAWKEKIDQEYRQ